MRTHREAREPLLSPGRSPYNHLGLIMSPTLSILLPILIQAQAAAPAKAPPGLECETPEQAEAGQPLNLNCSARPELNAVAVVLFHRAPGNEAFVPTPALRTARSMFRVSLCSDVLSTGTFHFYYEARDADDKVVATSGDLAEPHLLAVGGHSRQLTAVPSGARTRSRINDEDPLADARAERDAEKLAAERSVQRAPGSFFLGFGAGFGYGVYPESRLDFRRDLRIQSNSGPAGLLLLTPELGYQVSQQLAVGVQLYWQQMQGSGIGDAQTGSPARQSFTALARGSYHVGDGRLQWIASAFVGGGQGFHVVVPPLPDQGLRRNDSVRAGPFVVGPGAGMLVHLFPHAALIAEVRVLTGMPRWAALVDSRVGAEVSF